MREVDEERKKRTKRKKGGGGGVVLIGRMKKGERDKETKERDRLTPFR